jgi:hypothetical protein
MKWIHEQRGHGDEPCSQRLLAEFGRYAHRCLLVVSRRPPQNIASRSAGDTTSADDHFFIPSQSHEFTLPSTSQQISCVVRSTAPSFRTRGNTNSLFYDRAYGNLRFLTLIRTQQRIMLIQRRNAYRLHRRWNRSLTSRWR